MKKEDFEVDIVLDDCVPPTREEYNKLLNRINLLENNLQRAVSSHTAIVQAQEVVAKTAARLLTALSEKCNNLEEVYSMLLQTVEYHTTTLENILCDEFEEGSADKSTQDLLALPNAHETKKLVN